MNETQQKLLESKARELGEYFTSVAIFVYDYNYETAKETQGWVASGGLVPIKTVVNDFLLSQESYTRTTAAKEQLEALDEEEE